MQVETELRNTTMRELTVHEYCEKVKQFGDLLDVLGEPVRERNLVIYAINALSSKYEGVVCIYRFTRPFYYFSEM